VSDAPLDKRLYARAQLEHFAQALYSDPTAALAAMREAAHLEGTEAVRQQLEQDFKAYGEPAERLRGPDGEVAQRALREAGLAADLEGWLRLDHAGPGVQGGPETEIERAVNGPDAESLGRNPTDPSAGDAPHARIDDQGARRQHLSPDESAALEQVEAFAAARERAARRATAEGQLHDVADYLANLRAAEEKIPAAREALKAELPGVYRDPAAAGEVIDQAIRKDGPAETARRVRSGDLLAREQKKVFHKDRSLGVFPRRNRGAEALDRERVAQRIETVALYEGDLGKWSTYQPLDGPAVEGAKNVRAALDRDKARIIADGEIGPGDVREIEKSKAIKPHPSREAERLERSARAGGEVLFRRPAPHVRSDLRDEAERLVGSNPVDLGEVRTGKPMEMTADVEARLLASRLSFGAAWGQRGSRVLRLRGKRLEMALDRGVALGQHALIILEEGEVLLEGEDVLGAVVARQCRHELLRGGMAAWITVKNELLRIGSSVHDVVQDRQTRGARDVGDDLGKLHIHLDQRLLHPLDRAAHLGHQRIAMADVAT
jgi:hypothetical protein